MSRNITNSGLYDSNMIDGRNERPLTIAFATIVTMWLLGFGLVFVSTHLSAELRSDRAKCGADRWVDRQVIGTTRSPTRRDTEPTPASEKR